MVCNQLACVKIDELYTRSAGENILLRGLVPVTAMVMPGWPVLFVREAFLDLARVKVAAVVVITLASSRVFAYPDEISTRHYSTQ